MKKALLLKLHWHKVAEDEGTEALARVFDRLFAAALQIHMKGEADLDAASEGQYRENHQ